MIEPLEQYANIQPLVKKEIDNAILAYAQNSKYNMSQILTHAHNGIDVQKIEYGDIGNKLFYIYHTVPGVQAATATNYNIFFIAPFYCTILQVQEIHTTAGTDAGTVKLDVSSVVGSTYQSLLPAGGEINLKGTAYTVQTPTLVPYSTGFMYLNPGDRIAVSTNGTLTSVANVTVLITLKIN